jgi:hypothetical protein
MGEQNVILAALDALGLALVEHEHVWSDELRKLYDDAVAEAKALGAAEEDG